MPKCWSNFRNGFSVFFSVNKFPLHRLNLNSKRARGTSPFREHGKSSASVVRCHVVSKFQLFYLIFKSTSWELPFGKSLPFFARQTLHWLQLLNSPVHYFYSFFFHFAFASFYRGKAWKGLDGTKVSILCFSHQAFDYRKTTHSLGMMELCQCY